jgi:hypothetical protein
VRTQVQPRSGEFRSTVDEEADLTRYPHATRVAFVSGLATVAALSLSAAPAMATRICPPGTTNPAYCADIAPVATTTPANGVGADRAQLNGVAGPAVTNGDPTAYQFEYGKTTAYGTTTAAQKVPTGVAAADVFAKITGLSPSTTYHYRIIAANADGKATGEDMTFTTAPPPKQVHPIGKITAPRTVRHNHFFVVVVHLNIPSRTTFTLTLHGKVIKRLTQRTRSGTFGERIRAPRKLGVYLIKVNAIGGGQNQTSVRKTRVF